MLSNQLKLQKYRANPPIRNRGGRGAGVWGMECRSTTRKSKKYETFHSFNPFQIPNVRLAFGTTQVQPRLRPV